MFWSQTFKSHRWFQDGVTSQIQVILHQNALSFVLEVGLCSLCSSDVYKAPWIPTVSLNTEKDLDYFTQVAKFFIEIKTPRKYLVYWTFVMLHTTQKTSAWATLFFFRFEETLTQNTPRHSQKGVFFLQLPYLPLCIPDCPTSLFLHWCQSKHSWAIPNWLKRKPREMTEINSQGKPCDPFWWQWNTDTKLTD